MSVLRSPIKPSNCSNVRSHRPGRTLSSMHTYKEKGDL
jgi:hypothetical protein